MLKQSFKIDSNIYKEDLINTAIKDFLEIAKISYDNWNLVIVADEDSDISEIFNEFMNYVIWLNNELI